MKKYLQLNARESRMTAN